MFWISTVCWTAFTVSLSVPVYTICLKSPFISHCLLTCLKLGVCSVPVCLYQSWSFACLCYFLYCKPLLRQQFFGPSSAIAPVLLLPVGPPSCLTPNFHRKWWWRGRWSCCRCWIKSQLSIKWVQRESKMHGHFKLPWWLLHLYDFSIFYRPCCIICWALSREIPHITSVYYCSGHRRPTPTL